MKLSDIQTTIDILKKIRLPSSPKSRRKLLEITVELETELEVVEKLKKTYYTDELITLEREKLNYVKQFDSSEKGIDILGVNVNPSDAPIIVETLDKMNTAPEFVNYMKLKEYLKTNYSPSRFINIDELPDDVFNNLSSEEIDTLMLIIK